MYRVDRSCISVVSHPGDFAELRFVEVCICYDHRNRRIACEFVIDCLNRSTHGFHCARELCFVLAEKAGYLIPGLPVVDITQGVDDHDRSDLQIANLNGIAADARLHGSFHAGDLSDRGTASCPVVAVLVVRIFKCRFRCLISHLTIRPHIRCAYSEIIYIRLHHERHLRDAGIEADVVFFQIIHDAICRTQAECTAA